MLELGGPVLAMLLSLAVGVIASVVALKTGSPAATTIAAAGALGSGAGYGAKTLAKRRGPPELESNSGKD